MAFADTNIIPVQLDYRFVTTRKIWQYDYGQILSITGQNLPTATEVHFSLDIRGGSTLSRVGTTVDGTTTVKIPDELLKNNGKSGDFSIYAFIYVADEKSGNTEYRITIPVYSRPKPENPSEGPIPEPNIFHETVTAVNNAADRAEKAVKDTEQIRDNLNLDLSEKITRPQSAKVGQVIAVKEVGTDGKPTDFEAKDMTGGASTEEIKEAVGAYMQEHPFEETDPTVPDWAKQPEKPTYTAEDVGALPDNTKIPTKTSELDNDSGFLTSPPTPEVGKILKIKSVNEDGTFTCEWADDGGSNLDVRIDGKSIVQDGVAEIPISSFDTLGLVYTDNSAGGYTTGLMNRQGRLQVNTASIDDVNKRRLRKEIDCSNFDYAVKAAMCDGKGAAWTAEEQAASRERMGLYGNWQLKSSFTLESPVAYIDILDNLNTNEVYLEGSDFLLCNVDGAPISGSSGMSFAVNDTNMPPIMLGNMFGTQYKTNFYAYIKRIKNVILIAVIYGNTSVWQSSGNILSTVRTLRGDRKTDDTGKIYRVRIASPQYNTYHIQSGATVNVYTR